MQVGCVASNSTEFFQSIAKPACIFLVVQRALAQQDTERVLYEIFVRLYTLRNQLMHGGSTWNSSVNRTQVRDGRALLARVLPVMLGVMMQNPARFQGKPFYPVVSD